MRNSMYNYRIPPVEKAMNRAVRFIFYYRLVFVLLALAITAGTGMAVYRRSVPGDALRNSMLVITGGSVMIGIFYSILNYEHSQLKFRFDNRVSRETLTFNSTCKMYESEFIGHFRTLKIFYDTHRHLFRQGAFTELHAALKTDTAARLAFVILFNYFESIALGVQQGIMDEAFVKEFFRTVFLEYHQLFGPLLQSIRNETHAERLFRRYSQLAAQWKEENG